MIHNFRIKFEDIFFVVWCAGSFIFLPILFAKWLKARKAFWDGQKHFNEVLEEFKKRHKI